jgi:hypothetical protein
MVDQVATSQVIYYVHPDHLQRPVAMTNAGQSIAWSVTYTPFDAVQTINAPGKAGQAGLTSFHRFAQAPREILDILPGGAAGTRPPRERAFERLAFDFFARASKTEMLRVAMDHRKIIVLRTGMRTEPKPESVR